VRVVSPLRSGSAALNGLRGGTPETVARFRYDVASGRWEWSPEMFALHGFHPGEVQPSTELMMAHKHPQDRALTVVTLEQVLVDGQPFCCRHRIIDATGTVRTVLSLGEGVCDSAGAVVAVRGYFIDVTESPHREAAQAAAEAVRRSAESRAVIEQAKGILMAVYGIDADSAFAVLRTRSQNGNLKLRHVADGLLRQLAPEEAGELSLRQRVSAFLQLTPASEAHPPSTPSHSARKDCCDAHGWHGSLCRCDAAGAG
jgi:hypothetical protein